MTDKNDPGASPDLLAAPSKKGMGVRRLNNKPLFILCALSGLAIIGVSYTFHKRQQTNLNRPTAVEEIAIEEPTASPVRSVGTDFIPAESPNEIAPAPALGTPEVPALDQQLPMQGGQQMAPQPNEALEQRLRMIQRVEENKLASLEAALSAEAGVQSFDQGGTGGAQGAPGGPGNVVPALPGGSRPGAPGGAPGGMSPSQLAALAGGFGGMPGGMPGQRQDPNQQAAKRDFLAQEPAADTYLSHTRTPAISPYEVKAGTVIPGVMIGGINSDLPGQIIGQVRETVYDSATGGHVLIPAGARLVGTYDSAVTMGQRRVLVAWNRIIYPDGSSMSLGAMPGADQGGYAGFNDKVNNHYGRIFGNALMLSLFSAGIQLSQNDAPTGANGVYTNQQIMAAELGRQMGQLGMEMTRRNMDIQPTLEVRPGYLFNIMVTKDMVLPPWGGGIASTRE